MDGPNREIEIKLPFASAAAALARLTEAGAHPAGPRLFEDNRVFDLPDLALKRAGQLIRLRRVGDRRVLTFKAKLVPTERRYKIREEHETEVADDEAMARILAGLGYSPVYRYQKYRTLYELEGLQACLDETPIGCWVELEGRPDQIDRAAARLGFTPREYVLSTYRDLQAEWAARHGVAEPGDMVFGHPERR